MSGRLVDWIFLIFGLVGLIGVTWWSLYGGPKSAANLQEKLQSEAELALETAGHSWANVRLDGQSAIITGQSPSYDSADVAMADVLAAVGHGGLILGGITRVTESVQAARPISPYVWSATRMPEGELLLSGYVPSREIMNELIADADVIAPGEVRNELQLGTGEPYGDWAGLARRSLVYLDQLERGEVELVDATLTVTGVAPNKDARDALTTEITGLEDPYTGKAVIRSAGLWRARHSTSGLLLSGTVSSQSERNEINALANEYFLGRVQDTMTIEASAVGDWLAPVRASLPHFAGFQSGELSFAPHEGGFQLEGQASNSVITYLKQDIDALDTPWDLILNVEEVPVDLAELSAIDFAGPDRSVACESAFQTVLQNNSLVFEAGSADFLRDSGPTLDKLLVVTKRCKGIEIQVQGHTDSYGNRAGNIRLSEERAAAVVDYLTARGVSRDLLDPVGFGPDQPVASNDTADGRSANRRIEFRVLERG